MPAPRIGLALGSGSARGWSHIGVIDALAEAGIEPDIVCGTSIGALVGAVYVAGRLTELRQWAEAVTWREIVALMDFRLSGGGLIEGKLVVEFLRRLGIAGSVESYAKRYAAVATDLSTGREIWLQSESRMRRREFVLGSERRLHRTFVRWRSWRNSGRRCR